MSEPRKLTVIIPTRNRSALLAQALDSVLASPLVLPPAVLVVDDSSSDDTASIVCNRGVRYLRVAAGTPSATRNAGLAMAQTEFVAFLDDDDVWLPGNMQPQLAAMQSDPTAAFAYGRAQCVTPDLLTSIGEAHPAPPLASGRALSFLFQVHPQLGAVLFRRELLNSISGFDGELRYAEDSDVLIRLAARYPVVATDFVGVLYRLREPTLEDGDDRWASHKAYVAGLTKFKRQGVCPPWWVRVRADLRFRGMTASFFCADARCALQQGRRRKAFQYLSYALRVSPAHALLRVPQFWTTLGAVITPIASGGTR